MNYPLGDRRAFGVVLPLPALRSSRSGGVGEYPDLVEFGALCRSVGIDLIQLLPVNDSGRMSSPYSAQSAFALHPLYVRLADFPEAKDFMEAIAAIRKEFDDEDRFRYRELLGAKTAVLRAMFERNRKAIAADGELSAWTKGNAWVRPYAVYCSLKEKHSFCGWKEWGEHQAPKAADIDALAADPELADEILFTEWLQKRCEEQFSRAARELAAMGIFLKGDLPILMNEDSADVWASRVYFEPGLRAGAPPDMFSQYGQNWGFPIYDWAAIEKDAFSFWTERLAAADKFYSAYRIDHVLGFFRIWAMREREETGYLGRFVPGGGIPKKRLLESGFDNGRIRWMSEPHIRTEAFLETLHGVPDPAAEAARTAAVALDRIGTEELFLFKRSIRGERDILELPIHGNAKDFLVAAWRNRTLLEKEPDVFIPTWRHYESTAWETLSSMERNVLERLFGELRAADEREWEARGAKLLSALKNASRMLPCAEDLGAVPDCVPPTLARLGILGLRIPRWTRSWGAPGDPFIPPTEYPELSVCAPSVHDTSTLRDWWEHEAGKYEFWQSLTASAGAPEGEPCPEAWSPELALDLLLRLSGSTSRLLVTQVQDLLALSAAYAPADSRSERVNVPGTVNDFNWTWRMPATIETLAADEGWKRLVASIAAAREAGR
ncbi:MAG: 4-alpha-glucanotransferase [Spirochaetes bacterium]|nr:4-alpha-glucanotransferase [Spirochaetota bacterium]